jgi:hypothetical protein
VPFLIVDHQWFSNSFICGTLLGLSTILRLPTLNFNGKKMRFINSYDLSGILRESQQLKANAVDSYEFINANS